MIHKITYLLGAGASANAVPVLNFFGEQLDKFHKFLQDDVFANLTINHSVESNKKLLEITAKYIGEINNNFSPDTYARKLFIKKNWAELDRFKLFLSSFLVWQETKFTSKSEDINKIRDNGDDESKRKQIRLTQNTLDKRYDAFIGSLIDKDSYMLPSSLSIISWNYDAQIESSFIGFIPDGRRKNVHALLRTFSNEIKSDESRINDLNFIKLNGSATLLKNTMEDGIVGVSQNTLNWTKEGYTSKEYFSFLLEEILKEAKYRKNVPYLNFAWENEDLTIKLTKRACNIMAETDILVVIGYSFPNYNLKIDKELLIAFADHRRLQPKKIYIQDFKENMEALKFKINGLVPHVIRSKTNHESGSTFKIEPYPSVDQFLIPYELYN